MVSNAFCNSIKAIPVKRIESKKPINIVHNWLNKVNLLLQKHLRSGMY